MKSYKRFFPFIIPILFTFLCHLCHCSWQNHCFISVSADYFKASLIEDSLSLHYTLANPSDYDIFPSSIMLPCYVENSSGIPSDALQDTLHDLSVMDFSELSKPNRYFYTLLTKKLSISHTLETYPYYYEPLSPNSGMHTQLLILLAEYPFYQPDDVDDYLTLLSQMPDYLESLFLYEQEKADAGLLMPYASLKKTIDGCNTILSKEELLRGDHFMQETFASRLAPLKDNHTITDLQYKSYCRENTALLTDAICVAYRDLADDLTGLYEYCTPAAGLSHYPLGKEYYLTLIKNETGSYRPIDDIRTLLLGRMEDERQTLAHLITPELVDDWDRAMIPLTSEFPLQSTSDMLQHLYTSMAKDFPSISDKCVTQVKSVSPSLEEYTAPAFFLTPPIDCYENNIIYINESMVQPGLDHYTTLAHESFPGHLYQNMYCSEYLAHIPNAYLRSILWYGGYLEGWAVYTEFMSYDYASLLFENKGDDTAATMCQILKHNRSFLLSLYALMDLQIHYDGASQADIASLLTSAGINDTDVIYDVYTYIVEEPSNYMKYYLGYLEIMEIKKQAQSLWKETYSDYRFHKFLLEYGPADFDTLSLALHRLEKDT